ncbi:hypothetical protein [Limoniibacter endophyticus]|uniref:Uncharacterized protein n=1 Tax=Limoniibacter endophyticus TaxID=1565040 RepID=A0A8J3DFC0_9HYPH|nr:hypothetical protein [Limoniibacter endophyticus]GHC63746.1 hypothetical protein GCM10010136_05290 [Limoniibacter endophyticus]
MSYIRNSGRFFTEAFAVLRAATAASAAVEGHRRPKAADLKTLGIRGDAFDHLR